MPKQTLRHLASHLHRGTLLAATAFALASALTGCDGAGPTEPTIGPYIDPGRTDQKRPVLVEQESQAVIAVDPSTIQPILKAQQ
jgi:hypothetical protein